MDEFFFVFLNHKQVGILIKKLIYQVDDHLMQITGRDATAQRTTSNIIVIIYS